MGQTLSIFRSCLFGNVMIGSSEEREPLLRELRTSVTCEIEDNINESRNNLEKKIEMVDITVNSKLKEQDSVLRIEIDSTNELITESNLRIDKLEEKMEALKHVLN
jgi:BMFP domain-containing protein YqiC